jgi:hypothetical protein
MVDIGISIRSGALSSTAGDLYRWGVALHRNRLFDLDQQIEADWPYGWGKVEVGRYRGVEQTGALQGFMSSLAVFDDGTIVVMLLNLENGAWVQIARDIAAIVFEQPYETPTRRPSVALPTDLTPFTGRYALDDRVIEVRIVDGALWQFGDGWPVGKWLAPVAESEFAVPADVGRIRFEQPGPEGYNVLRWDFGESDVTYRRGG